VVRWNWVNRAICPPRWCRCCCRDEVWVPGISRSPRPGQPRFAHVPLVRNRRCWRVPVRRCGTSLGAVRAAALRAADPRGTPESATRGITALFVRLDSPGINSPPPIETITADPSCWPRCSSTTSSAVLTGTLGGEGDGWAFFAMDLLPLPSAARLCGSGRVPALWWGAGGGGGGGWGVGAVGGAVGLAAALAVAAERLIRNPAKPVR